MECNAPFLTLPGALRYYQLSVALLSENFSLSEGLFNKELVKT
ncbi:MULTISPECIES: hypothetical protein [Okeania]|nr:MULTISPECIES: hypothetical protein [Okeania]